MKTTIAIGEPLVEQARRLAASRQTTLKALVEQGLRLVIAGSVDTAEPFQLRKASFKGKGLQDDASFERQREMAYEGRGG